MQNETNKKQRTHLEYDLTCESNWNTVFNVACACIQMEVKSTQNTR